MTLSLDQVLQTALAPPEPERARLVEALLATLSVEEAAPLDDTWLAEIDRRSTEYEAGGVEALPWAEVRDRARRRFAPHD